MTDLAAAEALLFDDGLAVVSLEIDAAYQRFIGRLTLAGTPDGMLDGHARSIAIPELNRLFRSRTAIDDVECAAAQFAPRIARNPAEAGAAAVAAYKRGVASQLAARSGHELQHAAHAYLAGLAEAERIEAERIAAAERAAAAEAAAEAERQAAKRAAADKAAADKAAAEAAAHTAEGIARATQEAHRAARVRWLVAEIEASGIPRLRFNGRQLRGTYAQPEIIALLPSLNSEQLAAVEYALSAALEAAEAP